MSLAEKLQQLRKQNNLSQEQLAEKLGVSRQSVSKWESEQSVPELDKIINISEMFHVTTDYLLKDMGEHLSNSFVAPTDKKQNLSNKKVRLVIATICIGFSVISIFVMWVLSKIYPSPFILYNTKGIRWILEFNIFLQIHRLTFFYNICWLIATVGIVLLIFDKLKKLLRKKRVRFK